MSIKEFIAVDFRGALLGAVRFLESWPGVIAMWAALAIYCYW